MGLLRGVARTAVIAGTATAVSNRVSRRQAERWSATDQSVYQPAYASQPAPPQYAPEPAPAPSRDDIYDELAKLAKLHDDGVLTDEEFAAQKARVLNL
jgi:hypothetical protein